MPHSEFVMSGYKEMWLFAMLDLPVMSVRGLKPATDRRVKIGRGVVG